jgi:hypothetical protein
MTKEHVFPKWLIKKTKTEKSMMGWVGGKRVPYLSATLPICKACNSDFGNQLERPVSKIFFKIESNQGITENDAELLIRWLWKISGLAWIWNNPDGNYTQKYNLKQRVLLPIDEIRGHLILAISLINEIDPSYGDEPLGIDSINQIDAIFAAGVFSRIAVMVTIDLFEELIPDNFSKICLAPKKSSLSDAVLFYPKTGFYDDGRAVVETILISKKLSILHDKHAIDMQNRVKRDSAS